MSSAIVSIATDLLEVPLPTRMSGVGYGAINVPFVTVMDGAGRTGTGFAYTLDDGAAMVCRMVHDFVGPALLDRTEVEWDLVRADIMRRTRRLGATMFTAALSAVDIAIWDLRGRAAGRPLHNLLNGSGRPVPIYGSGRSGYQMNINQLVTASHEYFAQGYAAVKISVGTLDPAEDIRRVRAVRESVGPDARLMVDASEQLQFGDALWLGHRLAEFDLLWLEEPIAAEDVAGYAALARALPIPIATGEHLQSRTQILQYLSGTDVAIYQPDAALGGGITEMLAVRAVLASAHRSVSWHSLADLHIHLATAETEYVEDFPILEGIIADPLRPAGHMVIAPTRPGHGIAWDYSAIKRRRIGPTHFVGVAQ